MCSFGDLDCGSNDTLGKRKNNVHYMLDGGLILEMDEENMYPIIDPMLDEASLCLQVDHDVKCHIQIMSLCDSISEYCTSFLEKGFFFSKVSA